MKKLAVLLLCTALLAGCQQTKELGNHIGIGKPPPPQMMEGSNYYDFPEISPGKQYQSESTFCYKVQTDILCYDHPRQGWEDRMIGYQEPRRRVQKQAEQQRFGYHNSTSAIAAPIATHQQIQQAPLVPLPTTTVPAAQPIM